MNDSHCKRKRWPLLGIGLLATLLGGACGDMREVTAPAPAAAPQAGPALNNAAAALGSNFLSAPATSHPNDVASPPFQGSIPAPAGTWIIVRTSGQVQSKFNPDCALAATPYWDCGTGNQLSPFSSTFPSTVGPVQVVLRRGSSETPVPLRGSGGGGVGLFYSSTGGTLAGRVMMPANFWYAPGYNYIPAFQFSGGYELSAEAVPPPLEVSETGGGSNGARTYSAVPLYGLQLVNPADPYYFQYWPTGAVTWAFIRGENVSDDPRVPGVQRIPVNDCSFHVTCTFTPPGPGRMEATAWVEGRPVTVRSSPSEAQRLELDCNGVRGQTVAVTVVRGKMLDCNIRVTPTSALRGIVGWNFVGGGHVVPAAGEEPYTATGWPGLMVVDGTITVRVLLGADTVSATAQVTVEARPWVDRLAEPKVMYVSCPFPLTAECPLPEIPEHMNDFGRFDLGASSFPNQVLTINSGPNKGFQFLGGDESFLNVREPWIVLNDILRRPEHPFWASRKQCDVERFHQESLRHEQRHYAGLRQAFEEGGFTRGWLESWYAFGTTAEASASLRNMLEDFNAALFAAGDLNHTNPEFRTEWHCDPGVEYTQRSQQSPNPKAPGRNRTDPVP